MKLLCRNCNHPLTDDLYPEQNNTHLGVDDLQRNLVMRGGLFFWDKKFDCGYYVSKDSCSGVKFQEFRSGMGCCDSSYVDAHCSNCNKVVATEFSDCYEDRSVNFEEGDVVRWYKK